MYIVKYIKIMGERPLQGRYAAASGRFELTSLAVGIKKLLKTSKLEIIVRRSGYLVGSRPIPMEPAAGHVIKYYKDVLVIIGIAVGIKKLLKTIKFEIIVRRSGSLVVSVPSGSNSTVATT